MNYSSISLALLALLGAGSALAEAGRFQFVHGEVSIIRANGSQTAARKGDLVDEGDTIATGALAQAQLVMKDEGLIALRPDSRLRIDSYRFSGKADGSEQGVFGLIKGGFRSITGWIGRANKDNYKVRTPTATIGIRGTDHEALYIPPPVAGESPLGPPGTYDKVNTGQTYLETASGRVELSINQVGFVAASGTQPPVRLPAIPGFLKATPNLQTGAKAQQSDAPSAGDSSSASAPATTGSNETTSPVVESTAPAPLLSNTATAPAPALVLPSPLPTATAAPNGTVIAGGGMGSNGPSNGAAYIGDPSGNLSLMVDANGSPVSVKGNNFSYQRNDAPSVMRDAKTFSTETVRWGIYDGGTMVDNGVTSSKTTFFWMTATSATTSANLLSALPASGATLSLNTIGGFTEPITENGKRGSTFISSSITLKNLGGTPTVDSYQLKVTDALSRTWNTSLTASQSLASFRSGNTQNLAGTCTGCGQASTSPISVTGNAQGVVIGNPTPVGMVSSYQMKAGTASVAGSVLTLPTR
jgi:hypothetical protein